MSRQVVVIGAGGHAKVVIATLQAAGDTIAAVYDDNESLWGTALMGILVKGPIAALTEAALTEAALSKAALSEAALSDDFSSISAVIAVGNNAVRQRLADELKLHWISAVHPQACVHSSVNIGVGTVIFAGAIVQPDTSIGAHVIVNTGATIDHDCIIGDCVHLAPGSHLAGNVHVEKGAFCGIASAVIPGMKIGAWSTVGAGAVVVRDVVTSTVVVGVPARPLNQNPSSKI